MFAAALCGIDQPIELVWERDLLGSKFFDPLIAPNFFLLGELATLFGSERPESPRVGIAQDFELLQHRQAGDIGRRRHGNIAPLDALHQLWRPMLAHGAG
jgi:hypothetical protein